MDTKIDPTRIRQIQEWLLQGQLITDILRNIINKWQLDEKAALEHIASAFKDFDSKTLKEYSEIKAFHIQMRLNLYKKAIEDKEYRIALQVLQDLAKLQDIS